MGPCADEEPDIETCSLCTERGPFSEESPTTSVFRAFGEGPSLRVGPCAEKGSDTNNVFYMLRWDPWFEEGSTLEEVSPGKNPFLMTKVY